VISNRYVIARERNVVRVDFRREPDPPAPKFPGAAALRTGARLEQSVEAFNTTFIKAEPNRDRQSLPELQIVA
jgi:hypothetical protein